MTPLCIVRALTLGIPAWLCIGFTGTLAHAQSTVRVTIEDRELVEKNAVQGWNNQTVCAQGAEASFGLIFGAAPGVGAGRTSWGEFRIKKNESGGDEPEWFVHDGYAAARGWRPRIRTTIVSMIPVSCDVIVEIDNTLGVHRAYLDQSDGKARVYIEGDPKAYELMPKQFIEVDSGSRKLRRGPMPYDAAAADFVARATSQPRFQQLGEKGCMPTPAP